MIYILHFVGNMMRRHSCNVTLEDLRQQWEKQKGRCPYTGWKLKNLINTCHNNQLPRTNIKFVSIMAQFAKMIGQQMNC